MAHFTTSGVIRSDTKVESYTHDYRGDSNLGVITSIDVGGSAGTVHFQGDPDVMLAFADRIRDAVAASVAAHEATKVAVDA